MTSGMSITPHPDLLHAGVSPGSFHTVSSRPRPRAPSNSLASKRVCFYKSGDPQFGGLRMVVNVRTFKTFDALLDALSKKVPLPFGVRTITTPHGTNSIRALEELQDGGSYVCSDRKRVKPLNLEQANRRQVPWNTTRPISAWRRGNLRPMPRRADVAIRPARIIDRTIAVRTPKRLTVFKNRDPTVKRIVVLQRRIAPTFDALLDYLSQIMQFPVVKLFTPDGRRVEGLAGLILCSGVVVAGGTEHFRLTNFNFQSGGALNPTQAAFTMEQPRAPTQIYQKKSPSSSARSRKFSLSSERYIVNQIKKSLSESLSEHESHHSGSLGTFLNRPTESVDMDLPECTSGLNRRDCPAMPSEDDIEKSFRVNQDGSMTVEMKVRLTLKQEEMVHWTTTLSRTTVSCQYLGSCTLHSVSGPNSPDVSNDSSRNAGGHNAERAPEASHCHTATERTVAFTEQVDHYCSSAKAETSRNLKYSRRTPTPGPRHVKSHSASVENITTVTETAVQESTVGTYSYMEHTAEGDVTEGYCVVSRSSASSIRPVPKPRTMGSAEGKKNTLHPTVRASGVADALQIHNSDVTETVKYVYETQSQGNFENYIASPQHSLQKRPSPGNSPRAQSKQASTDSGPCLSNNDCDVDLTRRSTASESSNGKKDEMFSLSSGSMPPPQQQPKTASESSNGKKDEMSSLSSGSMPPQQQPKTASESSNGKKDEMFSLSSGSMPPQQQQPKTKTSTSSSRSAAHQSPSVNEDIRSKTESVTKRSVTSTSQKKSSPLSSRSERGQRNTGTTDSDNVAKTRSSAESLQNRKISRVKNSERNNGTPASKSTNSALSAEQSLNLNEGAVGDLSYNLNNSDSEKPKEPYRKNVQDILMSLPSGQTTVPKQKSLSNDRGRSPKRRREISDSASMPLLCSTPPVQQYVESWLQQVQPGIVPYMEELYLTEAENGCQTLEGLSTPADNDLSKGSEEIPCDEEGSLPAEDLSVDKAEQYPAVQLRCEGELLGDEPQGMRGFCRSMPSVRIHPADQDSKAKLHKSTEALFPLPAESEPPNDVTPNFTGGMKPMVQQLCLSLQSIRRVSSPMLPASLEKTRSLPDFSGQVASAFGASSFKLLSFLSVMTLKDGSDSLGSQISLRSTNSYCPEALKVMQSLEKLATTEDEQELRASLTDLRKSTSPKFQESWREFQEKYDIQDSPLASPKGTEQEFILEVQSETSDQRKEKAFDIEQLMEDLSSVSDELWQELSSLAEGEAIYHDLSVATGDTLPMNAPCSSSLIKARDLKNREDVDVTSTAETKEEDGAVDQIKNPALEDNAQDSPPVGECNMVGDYYTTASLTDISKNTPDVECEEERCSLGEGGMNCCDKSTDVTSQNSEKCRNSPKGRVDGRGSQLKEADMCSHSPVSGENELSEEKHDLTEIPKPVETQSASPPANTSEPPASNMTHDELVCSGQNSEQECMSSTNGNENSMKDLHILSADEQCNTHEAFKDNNSEGQDKPSSDELQYCKCPNVLPSQNEEGNVIAVDTDSSGRQSIASEARIKGSVVVAESELGNCQDLSEESVAQREERASSSEPEHSAPVQKHNSANSLQVLGQFNSPETLSVSSQDRKPLGSAERTKDQLNRSSQPVKTNKSERKGSKSQPSIKSSTSSNPGIRKPLSSTDALHLGVATSRSSSPKAQATNTASSLPAARKPATPANSGQTKKISKARPKSVNGDRLKSPKQDPPESVSVPFICAPPTDVHEYVGSWLEKMQPEPIICVEEVDHAEAEYQDRAVFKIGPDTTEESEDVSASEHLSAEEEGLSTEEHADKQQRLTPFLQVKCEVELPSHKGQSPRGFCRSMPSVRVQLADQDRNEKMHRSTEALFPLQGEPPNDVTPSFTGGMKPIVQQLRLSLQSIRRAVSPILPASLEKARSLPDFSGQVASVFGASSTKLLSFLSVMTLKDGSDSLASSQISLNSTNSYFPEALKVMQSLEKLASTEDEQELRASLTDLRKSTSPKFEESWREFQDKHDIQDSPLASPKGTEQEFALEVQSETGGEKKTEENSSVLEQLMEELSMCEELRQEIASLVGEEVPYQDGTEPSTSTAEEDSHSKHADTNTVDVDGSEAVVPDEFPEDTENENCLNESHMDEVNNETETPGTMNSVEEQDQETEEAHSIAEDYVGADNNIQAQNLETKNAVEEQEKDTDEVNSVMEDHFNVDNNIHANNVDTKNSSDEKDNCSEKQFTNSNSETNSNSIEAEQLEEHDSNQMINNMETNNSVDEQDECAEKTNSIDENDLEEEESIHKENLEMMPEAEQQDENTRKANSMDESQSCDSSSIPTKAVEINDTIDDGATSVDGSNDAASCKCEESQSCDSSSIPTKAVEINDTIDDGATSVGGSNDAASCKCEETSSPTAESEDIDRDRFLTPISEPEHKEIEKGSESFKGDVDTDCQSEQAKCELSEEDIAAVETAVNTDSPVEEEDGHIQEDGCHDELAANFTQAPSSAEEKEASPVSSSLDEGVSSHSGNGVSPSEMEGKSPDSQIDAQIPVLPRKIYSSGEYSQEFLDFVNKALLSSTLAFTYDCDGNLRIQPEICGDGMCIRSRMDAESEYGLKRLPSPCTSDLSDYRPETADSVASRLQYSADSSTGNEEIDTISQRSQHETDEVGEHSHDQGSASSAENRRESSPASVKSNISPESDVKSVCSLKSNEDPPPIDPHPQDIAHFSTSSSGKGDSESVQYMSFTKTELSEGVLIDKGRWLLKENHLIRTSPPQATEMYGQVDSSSAHSAHSHSSEEGPASQHANHPSAMLVYSSSELEEMAKPPTPKCTYFTIPHSSDSDPFHDDGCSIGSKQGDSMRGANKVFPQQEPPKTWARKNSSLSSFASVEFKLPDGKIHPEVAPIVERAPRSQAVGERRVQEQEPTESLRLRCGQLHCPIL